MSFVRPPVSEVGLSVSFNDATLFDPYDVKSVHDIFRSNYPNVERAPPTNGNETEISLGLPSLATDSTVRWWLGDKDNANVLQLQENYFARNWRRLATIDEAANYPGFDKLLADFERDLSTLQDHLSSTQSEIGSPRSCELMYDDIVPGLIENDTFKLSEMLTFWASGLSRRPMAGWQCAWMEPMQIEGMESRATLAVQFLAAGYPQEDFPPRPILRIIWKASAVGLPLDEIVPFFRQAHDLITVRFNELITQRVRDSWR